MGLFMGAERHFKHLWCGVKEQMKGRLFKNAAAQFIGQPGLMNQATTRMWR